jgi:hypothetical protein
MKDSAKRNFGPLRIPLQIQRIAWRDLAAALGPVLLLRACYELGLVL